MADELKPCPFCGGKVYRDDAFTGCDECNIEITTKDWNTRPIEDALRAEAAALKGELAKMLRAWGEGAAAREAEIDALKAMYEGPLTDEQVEIADDLFQRPEYGNWRDRDAAIRAARERA